MQSKQYSLNKKDYWEMARNMRRFLAPLALLYLAQLGGTLGTDGHMLHLTDLVPNQMTLGGFYLYLLNALNDLFNKWKAE
jgi:hypothetical protein